MNINTYLNYGGNCLEAFQFYEQHLGAKIAYKMTWGEMQGGPPIPEGYADKILHAHLVIADTAIMGNDVPPETFQPMRSAYLSLAVDSDEEADRIHALLAEGGEIFMPMNSTFFATRFSMLRDKFGTSWMVIHQRPMPSHA